MFENILFHETEQKALNNYILLWKPENNPESNRFELYLSRGYTRDVTVVFLEKCAQTRHQVLCLDVRVGYWTWESCRNSTFAGSFIDFSHFLFHVIMEAQMSCVVADHCWLFFVDL